MSDRQTRPGAEALRIAIGYAALSMLWILASDHLIFGLAQGDTALLSLMQNSKGVFYTVVVAVALYFIIRRVLARQMSSERELSALNIDLERRVAERTEQLEAANRELESFSYSVSHDLKAPLRGVDGYSQLLLLDHVERLDDEGRLLLGNVRSGVAQMHVLIEDMLAYSRIERRALESHVCDLGPIVKALITQREGDPDAQGVRLHSTLNELSACVDRDGFALALRNLIENGIKFSRAQEHAQVDIGGEDQGDRVCLWVCDNGIGFDMQYHDRIFDIFQRLHRAEDYPGTGIGLALVKKAVSRMGGRVWAESAPGQGARFFMELPK